MTHVGNLVPHGLFAKLPRVEPLGENTMRGGNVNLNYSHAIMHEIDILNSGKYAIG